MISYAQCKRLKNAIDRIIQKADDEMRKILSNAKIVEPGTTIEDVRELEEKLAEELKRQGESITKKLSQCTTMGQIKEVWESAKKEDTFVTESERIFAEVAAPSVSTYATAYLQETEHDMAVDSVSSGTVEQIRSWSTRLALILQKTTYGDIGKAIRNGVTDGKSLNEIVADVERVSVKEAYKRARSTAITEVLRAHSYAQQEAMIQDPAVTHKQWMHSGSWKNKPRRNHQNMNGQIVEKDKPFVLVGVDGVTYYPMMPRDMILPPAESINCHCRAIPVADESVLGMSLEDRKKLREKAMKEIDADWEEANDAEGKKRAGITGPTHEGRRSGIKPTKRDIREYRKYQKVLPSFAPDSIDKFVEMKDNIDTEPWLELKHKYRVVNAYTRNMGQMSDADILRFESIGVSAMHQFTGAARRKANIGVGELDGKILIANSKINSRSSPAFKNYKGDKSQLVLLNEEKVFEYVYVPVGTREKTFVDSEAKIFEYAAEIGGDGKPHALKILSERPMCESCRAVMTEFQVRFPNVSLQVVSGRADRAKESKEKAWRYK